MMKSSTTHPSNLYKEMGSPNLFLIHHSLTQFKGREREGMESQKQERRVKKMKGVLKIIALASFFSFILSCSSLISYLQQRFHLLSMYSNLVDKKCMFLLCNGIVGFIVGNFRGNFESLLHGEAINIVEETKEVDIKEMREPEVKNAVVLLGEKSVFKEEEEEEERVALLRGEVTLMDEDDEGVLVQDLAIVRIDALDDDGDNDGDDDDDDDDGDDDEIKDGFLSLEDLNKKCEDFIRKVKAEIKIRVPEVDYFLDI